MESLARSLSGQLEPIAAWFRGMNMPEPIIHWGHPLMMAIVVLILGSYVAYSGWKGRLSKDKDVAISNRATHRRLAPWMAIFIFMGYTGGVLSLVMQEHEILASPHFLTGTIVLALLALNGILSATKFGGGKPVLRTVHAYVGAGLMGLLVVHGLLGLRLGLSI
jgi:hypothetical protein